VKLNIKTATTLLACGVAAILTFSVFQVRSSLAKSGMSTAERLMAIEEIHQLKARYIRCMDTKDWACWEAVFAPHFHFKVGDTERHSVQEMMQEIRPSGLFDRVKTVSHAYDPEIEILSPTTARGIWGVDFLHYFAADAGPAQGREVLAPGHWSHTDGYYHDTYVKIDGRWLIQSEEILPRRETQGTLGE